MDNAPPQHVSDAVARRRSIRAFLPRAVPRALITEVLEKAQMAPSSYNLQPWRAVMLGGRKLLDLSTELKALPHDGPADYQLVSPTTPAHYFARRDVNMDLRMAAMGIDRADTAAREAFQRRNLDFFGAGASLFVFVPRALSVNNWASVGLWLNTVMLLLVEAGLGSCPQEVMAHYPAAIKAACGVDDAEYFLWCGLAIGWPDRTAPVNNYQRPRVPLAESVGFIGFD